MMPTEKNIIDTLYEAKKSCATPGNENPDDGSECKPDEETVEEEKMLSYEKKVVVMYELLSACLANAPVGSRTSKKRKDYDAHHHVTLHLLATWLDIKWVNVRWLWYSKRSQNKRKPSHKKVGGPSGSEEVQKELKMYI